MIDSNAFSERRCKKSLRKSPATNNVGKLYHNLAMMTNA